MKNISRRVFIKGLAVAGVAAAASTVLAGCNTNMIPGVDDGNEDEGTETPSNQKVTLTDPAADKSMIIEATSFQYVSSMKQAIVTLHADNQLDDLVNFATTASTAADEYYLGVAFETVDKLGNTSTTGAKAATLKDDVDDNAFNDATAFELLSKENKDVKLYITMPEEKDWEKITVKFTLQRGYDGNTAGKGTVATGKLTYNK